MEMLLGVARKTISTYVNHISPTVIDDVVAAEGQAPAGPERIQAARQLLESYYKQIIVDGFFHADPPPRQPDDPNRGRNVQYRCDS